MNINSDLSSSIINLYRYSSLNLSSSTNYSPLSATDSSSLSTLAQSLLNGSSDSTGDSSGGEVSTYYQMGNYGKIIQNYASRSVGTDTDESPEVEETEENAEGNAPVYSWNMAMSVAGQRSITSGIISLYKSSSGEEREALKEQIMAGLNTAEASNASYLSTKNSVSSDTWQQLRNSILGVSNRDDQNSSLIKTNLNNLDGVKLNSAQRQEMSNLQKQVLAVNSYTQLSSFLSKINFSG